MEEELVSQGNYMTKNGSRASVWEWGKNALGVECWLGTVEGVGFCSWGKNGLDLSGDNRFDLVEKIQKP